MMQIETIPVLSDNYAWLLRGKDFCAVVDPGEADPVREALEKTGDRLDMILLTHHHADHIGGAAVLRGRYGAKIAAAAADAYRLPFPIDIALVPGRDFDIGGEPADILFLPGHTANHIGFHLPESRALFCGDTLFSMGCGRLFEGTAKDMFASMRMIAALPENTLICCGHEYTLSNGRFASSVDPDNRALAVRIEDVQALRAIGKSTVPVLLSLEQKTNPFLRAKDAETLGQLRQAKDARRE